MESKQMLLLYVSQRFSFNIIKPIYHGYMHCTFNSD